ncbi:MAG: GerMN domain-containing protein [Trichodesmium sp. MAG_R03]|nr:GerMN domain-containing protein [Trichodesmium sp. MAG_R03]
MKEQNKTSNLSVNIVASICTLAVIVVSGIALWTNSQHDATKTSNNSQAPTKLPTQESLSPPPATINSPDSQEEFPLSITSEPLAVKEKIVELYWVKDTATDIGLVSSRVKIKATDKPEAILTAAFERLLSRPENTDVMSAIPKGTKVQALTVENNAVYIDLSQEFTYGGGSASMIGRLGQVIYTASSLEPNVKVRIFVEGKPLEILGGEGLEVSQPMTRQNFQQEFQF